MNAFSKNDNNIFARYADSSVLAPVVSRPLAGFGKDGAASLPVNGFVGVYRPDSNGQPVSLGVVSSSYQIVQFRDLVAQAEEAFRQQLTDEQLRSIKVVDRSARGGAWVERRYTIHAFEGSLTYGGRKGREVGTKLAAELRLRTGYDGNTRTSLAAGTIDLVCTNGAVALREVDLISKKHTSKNNVENVFAPWIQNAIPEYSRQIDQLRQWAQTAISYDAIKGAVAALPGVSERKAEQLLARIETEVRDRGLNAYAVTSAFTYYSSHNSAEFKVRDTGNDNVETTLADRQVEVQRWLKSPAFQGLLAA